MRNYQIMRYLLTVCWIIGNMPSGWAAEGGSTYTQRPDDPEAFYFTPENYGLWKVRRDRCTSRGNQSGEARKELWDTVSAGRKLSY